MRNLIIIGILGCVAFTAGWFTIHKDGDKTTIQFNRAEIRQDTRRVIEKGREILDKRSDQFASEQTQPQQDLRFADRNAGYQQPDPAYQQPGYQQTGYPQPYNQQANNQQSNNQQSNNQQGNYQQGNYQDPNQAPWNQNYGRPDPNAYDANNYQQRR